MRQALAGFFAIVVLTVMAAAQAPPRDRPPAAAPAKGPGAMLGDLSWQEAEKALTDTAVVVIPLGVATVEHGPQLKLNHNERLARYLASRVQAASAVIIAPPLTYHFYPTFLEYPGSTSLSRTTARDMTVDIVRSLSRYGPRRFYVLNTGVTTKAPLSDAAAALRNDGILLGYTDPTLYLRGSSVVELRQADTRGVGHADEVETSMMLFVDPSAVDMSKAVREYGPGSGPMTRQKDAPGLHSDSGVFGDPTVATREKGQVLVDSLLAGALADIDKVRSAELPEPRASTPPPPPAPAARPAARAQDAQERAINGCTAMEDRTIRQVGTLFSVYWKQMDAVHIGQLFTSDGDMRHPDGTIERGPTMIRQNREELFARKEYRGSTHPLTLGDVRCLTPNVAIADGKWELRLVEAAEATAPGRGLTPDRYNTGWCTLVMVGGGDSWHIAAWRYTVNPSTGAPPTTLKQPGFIRGGGGG